MIIPLLYLMHPETGPLVFPFCLRLLSINSGRASDWPHPEIWFTCSLDSRSRRLQHVMSLTLSLMSSLELARPASAIGCACTSAHLHTSLSPELSATSFLFLLTTEGTRWSACKRLSPLPLRSYPHQHQIKSGRCASCSAFLFLSSSYHLYLCEILPIATSPSLDIPLLPFVLRYTQFRNHVQPSI